MKATVLHRSFRNSHQMIKDGKLLQREANKMFMESLQKGTPRPECYLSVRRAAEELLHMWDFQAKEIEHFGRLHCRYPTSKKVLYRSRLDSDGGETLLFGQGGSIGYIPKACDNCENLPAGSSDCIYYGCNDN